MNDEKHPKHRFLPSERFPSQRSSQKEKVAPPIRVRLANQEDVNFIFNSWLRSFRGSYFAKAVSNTIYYSEHHKLIENILKTSDVRVACNDNDPDQIYGFICASRFDGIFTLHYIYVKHMFRSLGIGKALLNSFDHDHDHAALYTHQTKIASVLGPKYNFFYHPYLLINHLDVPDEREHDFEVNVNPTKSKDGE